MFKRLFDICLSSVGLAFSLPLWALIMLAIRVEDEGPVFYQQRRVGKDAREFVIVKFRSMVADSDETWGAIPASSADSRISRVGRALRATAMDELPQLWSILRGDMSFVGPRPEWVELVKEFRKTVPGFDRRHAVQPGLTGIAQLYGHSELPRRQKLRYDMLYIKNQNFRLDLQLLLVSFLVSLQGKCEHRGRKFSWFMSSGRWWRRQKPGKRQRSQESSHWPTERKPLSPSPLAGADR